MTSAAAHTDRAGELQRGLRQRGEMAVANPRVGSFMVTACAQLRMRRRLREATEQLALRMWLYPWLTYGAIAAMTAGIAATALVDDVRDQLSWSLGSLAVVLTLAFWHTRRQPCRAARRPVGVA